MPSKEEFDVPSIEKKWCVPEEENTVPKLLRERARQFPNRRALGTREFFADGARGPYEWLSYADFAALAALCAAGLQRLGLRKGERVGIISSNRPEWNVVDFACAVLGLVLVPLYDSQSQSDIQFVIEET